MPGKHVRGETQKGGGLMNGTGNIFIPYWQVSVVCSEHQLAACGRPC